MRRRVGLLCVALTLLAGCGGPGLDPDDPGAPPPDGVVVVAPRLEPPPARGEALDREGALRVAQAHPDPGDAIVALDARPFEFTLDEATIDWFGGQGVDPQVLDYLRKRAAVDWDALRGDIDPDAGPR